MRQAEVVPCNLMKGAEMQTASGQMPVHSGDAERQDRATCAAGLLDTVDTCPQIRQKAMSPRVPRAGPNAPAPIMFLICSPKGRRESIEQSRDVASWGQRRDLAPIGLVAQFRRATRARLATDQPGDARPSGDGADAVFAGGPDGRVAAAIPMKTSAAPTR